MGLGDSGRGKLQCVPFITLKRLSRLGSFFRASPLMSLPSLGAGYIGIGSLCSVGLTLWIVLRHREWA